MAGLVMRTPLFMWRNPMRMHFIEFYLYGHSVMRHLYNWKRRRGLAR